MADFPVATQDDIAAAQAREAAGRAVAEAANLAWRTNTAPILPVMGAGSYSGITQEQQADAAREAAKHAAAFHPAEYYGVSPSSLGNVPLSQIAARYGTGFADIVQGYYTQNPTAEARAITSQYAAQHAIAENPFDPNSALGIAWEVSRVTGGTGNITESLKAKAIEQTKPGLAPFGGMEYSAADRLRGEKMVADLSTVTGMETVPIRGPSQYTDKTVDMYMAVGGYQGVEIPNAKLAIDYQTGEFGVYAQPYGHSVYNLIGGGGRAAAQSGMFSVGTSLWDPAHTFQLSDIGKMQPVSAEYQATHSKAGAEAYGGLSMQLRPDALLTPNQAISRYYGAGTDTNIANLVQQIPAGKAEAPGAKIPWSVEAGAPALSYMDERGIIPGPGIITEIPKPFKSTSPMTPTVSVKSSASLENIRESTMGQAPWLFEGLAEVGVWAGSIDVTSPTKTSMNIVKNIALDVQATKSYSGAIAHTQQHETGFFNRETLIYGEAGSDKLLSTVKGGYGFVSGAEAPKGATAVAHTHTEPLPFLNLFGLYSPVASAEDLSGAAAKRAAGITQESVITKGGVLTYATPSAGEVMGSPETYKSATAMGGVFGASNVTQQEFLEKTGTKYNVTPSYVPLAGSVQTPIPIPFISTSQPAKQTTVEKQVIASTPTYGTTEAGSVPSELPRPYISASTGVIAPTGEVSVDLFGNKATLLPAGIPVISDVVKFFQPQQRVTTTMTGETILPEETRLIKTETTPLKEVSSYLGFTQKEIPGGIETTKYYEKMGGSETISTYEKTGGIQREFATTVAPIPKSSGLDIFEQTVRETLRLPSVEVGEKIAKTAQWANPYVMPSLVAGETQKAITGFAFGKESEQAKQAEITAESMYALAPASLKGQYEMFYEHPTMSALSYGAGGAIGTVAKAGEGLYMAGRAGMAERAISQGGVWRAAEQATGTVVSRAPQVLAALYSVDIAGRSTEGFTNLSPASAIPKARAIVTQEAYPMMAGFEAPSAVAKTVKTAEIGYKAALQEGTAGSRLEYYVKQPVTKPYELAKQDYAAFKQERPDLPLTTTLYRGEAPGVVAGITPKQAPTTGLWFTEDPYYAQMYGSKVYSVEVPSSDLGKYFVKSRPVGKGGLVTSEYILPEPLAELKTRYVGELDIAGGDVYKSATSPISSYVQYKAERAVRSAAMPFQAFAQEAPEKITSAVSAAKGVPSKVMGIFDQPYAVETTRGYYPYAGIEKVAYPKTAGIKLPTSQDIFISGYSGYYGARATAIEKARGVGATIKGGAERAAAVVAGTPGVSVGVRPEPLGETLLNVFYTPRLGKVIPPSTFGETKPIGGFITATVGGAGTEATGKPAGTPPAPASFRKTPYGTGLAKEPSLKSMGVSERAAPVGKSTLRGEQVTDFRGKPVSERMKPMERGTYGPQGAQAAGQPRLLMEELPKVEGITQGGIAPQEMRFVSGAPSLQQAGRTGVVQVTEPSLAFTQERRQQQFAGVIPVVSVIPAAMVSTAVESRARQGVAQAARQAQITSVIPSFAQTAETRTTQAARQAATRTYARDLITTPITRTGMATSVTPFQAVDTRTSQETKRTQITETKPFIDTWKKPWVEPVIERGGGGFAWPGGAVGGGGTRKRKAAFMETFMMGLDISLRGRRTKVAKSFTTPKKYKRTAPAKKKGGKK